jgi:hypothetical protein
MMLLSIVIGELEHPFFAQVLVKGISTEIITFIISYNTDP